MDGISQKENLTLDGTSFQPSKFRYTAAGKLATPRTPFHIHSDRRSPSTHKKGLKTTATKTRRALGDISNHHQNRTANHEKADDASSIQKKITFECNKSAILKTPRTKKAALRSVQSTPKATTRPYASSICTSDTFDAVDDDVEEIEYAYGGGVGSLGPEASYLQAIAREINDAIETNRTKSLMDAVESPPQWWNAPHEAEWPRPEEEEEDAALNADEVPPPDELSDVSLPMSDFDERSIALAFETDADE